MRGAVLYAPGDVRVEERDDPKILEPAGRIQAGGVGKEVTFADVGHDLDDQIDAVYRAKYGGYGGTYVEPMVTPAARATTLRLLPR